MKIKREVFVLSIIKNNDISTLDIKVFNKFKFLADWIKLNMKHLDESLKETGFEGFDIKNRLREEGKFTFQDVIFSYKTETLTVSIDDTEIQDRVNKLVNQKLAKRSRKNRAHRAAKNNSHGRISMWKEKDEVSETKEDVFSPGYTPEDSNTGIGGKILSLFS